MDRQRSNEKKKRKDTPFVAFMKKEMAAIKAAQPSLGHKATFELAASRVHSINFFYSSISLDPPYSLVEGGS